MSRKKAILIIILTILIGFLGLGAWYLFLSPKSGAVSEESPINSVVSFFFPKDTGVDGPTNNTGGQEENQDTEENPQEVGDGGPAPTVREISSSATAGFIVINDRSKGQVVHFIESGTGNTWSAPLEILSKSRTTNTTIPKVREAFWVRDGKTVIARFLDENGLNIKTFSGKPTSTTTDLGVVSEGSLQGKFLEDNIVEVALGPRPDKIFYLINEGGGAEGIVSNVDGSLGVRIFSSLIREWIPQWVGETSVYLTTKASYAYAGQLTRVNSGNGLRLNILSGIVGLTTNVNPGNTDLLYSEGGVNNVDLYKYNISSRTSQRVSLSTLPEKCAWDLTDEEIIYCGIPRRIPSGEYPDSWYKGVVSFNDELWKINTETSEVNLITDFENVTTKEMDIIKPQVSSDGKFFVFINKGDLSLWSVRLE